MEFTVSFLQHCTHLRNLAMESQHESRSPPLFSCTTSNTIPFEYQSAYMSTLFVKLLHTCLLFDGNTFVLILCRLEICYPTTLCVLVFWPVIVLWSCVWAHLYPQIVWWQARQIRLGLHSTWPQRTPIMSRSYHTSLLPRRVIKKKITAKTNPKHVLCLICLKLCAIIRNEIYDR